MKVNVIPRWTLKLCSLFSMLGSLMLPGSAMAANVAVDCSVQTPSAFRSVQPALDLDKLRFSSFQKASGSDMTPQGLFAATCRLQPFAQQLNSFHAAVIRWWFAHLHFTKESSRAAESKWWGK